MRKIYLDHAATTPMHPKVIGEMNRIMKNVFGNPSSIHSFGREARLELQIARKKVAESIQSTENEITFTSGATEANNIVIRGITQKYKSNGKHIITTSVEHPSVLQTMKELETLGFEVTYLPVTETGELVFDTLAENLREDTILVSIMYGNNETGVKFPIAEIGERLKDHPAYFHSDAVQAYGTEKIDVEELGVDLLTFSAHKFNGPKGVGFFYHKKGLVIPSLMKGGEQETRLRPGTENLAGIVGMSQAIELYTKEEKKQKIKQFLTFKDSIFQELDKHKIRYIINGNSMQKLPHILNLHLLGIPSNLLLVNLDLGGIAISAGSACTAGSLHPSHVLQSMYGSTHPALQESVRISFGMDTTEQEVYLFCQALVEHCLKLHSK